jgi:hypothetical protein
MKRPLFLALATLVALVAPTKTVDGQSRRLPGHEREPNSNSVIRMVPVPPASTAAADSYLQGRRLTTQEELGHWPHPLYLDQTIYATGRQKTSL